MFIIGLVDAGIKPIRLTTELGLPVGLFGGSLVQIITRPVALVVSVSRWIRVPNPQLVPSLLSKSNSAILPSSAAALITWHDVASLVAGENFASSMPPLRLTTSGPATGSRRPLLRGT